MRKLVLESALVLISALAVPFSLAQAATLPSLSLYAGGAVRDAPFDQRNPSPTPMPAPAATSHYAGLMLGSGTCKK